MFFSSVQRKEYAETLNKNPDSFQVRVEVGNLLLRDDMLIILSLVSTSLHKPAPPTASVHL